MKTKLVSVSTLREYPGNYNRHPGSQIDALKRSLTDYGQYKNVVVWNGQVIAGNGLVTAARESGMERLAVVDVSHLSEEQAQRLLIADNALATMAEPDAESLQTLLAGLGDPLEIPGVTGDWLDAVGAVPETGGGVPGNAEAPGRPPASAYKEQYGVIIICTDAGHQEKVYNEMIAAGYKDVKVVNT